MDLASIRRQVDFQCAVFGECPLNDVARVGHGLEGYGIVRAGGVVVGKAHTQNLGSVLHDILGRAALYFCLAFDFGGDRHLVLRQKDVARAAKVFQLSIARKIPYRLPASESLFSRDGKQPVALLNLVGGCLTPLFFRRQIERAVPVPIGTVEIGEGHREDARRRTLGPATAFLVQLARCSSSVWHRDLEGQAFLWLLLQIHDVNLQRGLLHQRPHLRRRDGGFVALARRGPLDDPAQENEAVGIAGWIPIGRQFRTGLTEEGGKVSLRARFLGQAIEYTLGFVMAGHLVAVPVWRSSQINVHDQLVLPTGVAEPIAGAGLDFPHQQALLGRGARRLLARLGVFP